MTGTRGLVAFLAVSAVGIAADLVTKWWAFHPTHGLGPFREQPLANAPRALVSWIPGLGVDLRLAMNEGAAFSMFEGQLYFFYVVSVAAFALLCYFAWSAPAGTTWRFSVVLGMLGGGVVGNLYDRLLLGRVRDFIDVYVSHEASARKLVGWFKTNHWPTFNVADALICVGAVSLVILFLRAPQPADDREAETAGAGAAT